MNDSQITIPHTNLPQNGLIEWRVRVHHKLLQVTSLYVIGSTHDRRVADYGDNNNFKCLKKKCFKSRTWSWSTAAAATTRRTRLIYVGKSASLHVVWPRFQKSNFKLKMAIVEFDQCQVTQFSTSPGSDTGGCPPQADGHRA